MSASRDRLNAALEGRYRVERALGEGGMAAVYLAHDLRHDRKVALKVLKPEVALAVGAERFLAEIKTTANLQHPHILPLFDSGDVGNLVFYAMPYVEGESLRDRLDRDERIPVDEAVRLARAVAEGLDYAHRQGVVHRDIKPANILLQDGHPVVADFGISLALDAADARRLTRTGLAIGTVAYMSPEQATGEGEVDGRTDTYALGCVLYEMLVGRTPFEAGSDQAVLVRKIDGRIPDLAASSDSVPETVMDVVRVALAAQPSDRFDTPASFAAALSRAMSDDALAERASRIRRRRRIRYAGLTAAVAAVGWIGWWGWGVATRPSIERLSVLPPANVLNQPDQVPIVQGVHSSLINELSRAGVSVIGGVQSMARYRDTEMTVREIGTELGVDAVIESAVFWAGDSVGIDVRLIDAGTEESLWSQSYVEEARDVLALYRNVTRAVAEEIQLALSPEVRDRLSEARSVNPEAHEAYLRAQFHWNRLNAQDFETALDYLDLALQKDPDYAVAHAGVAWIRVAQQQLGILPPAEATPLAREAVATAMLLDPQSPEANHARGALGWATWDWEATEAGYRRSLELNPNLTMAMAGYSHYLAVTHRPEEALAQIDRALEIDPLNVQLMAFRGIVLYSQHRYEETIVQMERVVSLVPGMGLPYRGLWGSLERLEREAEALGTAEVIVGAAGGPEAAEALRVAYMEVGYEDALGQAADALVRAANERFVAPIEISQLYTKAGRLDEAMTWLARGVELREPNSPYISVIPDFDPLRDQPGFDELLERIGLPRGGSG